MVKKSILKTISSLISANRKLFLKNLFPSSLSNIKKIDITILQDSKVVLSIFRILISVFHILKSSQKIKAWLIILTSFFKSSKAFAFSLKIINTKYKVFITILHFFQLLTQRLLTPLLVFQLFRTLVSIVTFCLQI